MKKYVKPEVEIVSFEVEEIANINVDSGSGSGGDIVIPGIPPSAG